MPAAAGHSGEKALTLLLAWLSPSFPVGAFSYSHGIEAAVEARLVSDRATLVRWVAAILEHGAGRTDAVLFARTHEAVLAEDGPSFDRIAERADVLRATAETALESRAQGQAFLGTVGAAWAVPGLDRWTARLRALGRPCAYPVAVALAAALAGVPAGPALAAFLHGVVANLVSAGVRLVPLGQTDGQKALAALDPLVHDACVRARTGSLDEIGSRAPLVDWTSAIHETQYTRLFRS